MASLYVSVRKLTFLIFTDGTKTNKKHKGKTCNNFIASTQVVYMSKQCRFFFFNYEKLVEGGDI